MKTFKLILFCVMASTPLLLLAFYCVKEFVTTKSNPVFFEGPLGIDSVYDVKDPFLLFIALVLLVMVVLICLAILKPEIFK